MNTSRTDGESRNLINREDVSEHPKPYEAAIQETVRICDILMLQTTTFQRHETIEMLVQLMHSFLLEHKRLWYHVVTSFIYSKDEKDVGTMLHNLEWLLGEMYDAHFFLNHKIEGANPENFNNIRMAFSKLIDHVNLAAKQKNTLKLHESDFKDNYNNCFQESATEILQQMDERLANNSNNVISLIALFTAMAFLVFGGLSSFESIMSNMHQVSILKLVILSCIWGLGILNSIAVFMFFISKTVGKSFSHTSSKDATLFQKYPYIILGNYILIFIFTVSSWVYFCSRNAGESKILDYDFLDTSKICVVSFGTSLVALFLLVLFILMFYFKQIPDEKTKTPAED